MRAARRPAARHGRSAATPHTHAAAAAAAAPKFAARRRHNTAHQRWSPPAAPAPPAAPTMASFAGSSKDTVADLLVDKSASTPPGAKPAKAPDTEENTTATNNDGETMEALLEGSGGPDTPRVESKKHLPPPPDAMVGGEVGLTTDSQAPFVPSIAMVTEKPSDNGNLTKQDVEPSDVSRSTSPRNACSTTSPAASSPSRAMGTLPNGRGPTSTILE